MGKGYNNYMTKKPFHPGSKANIKRTWMAEQRSENEKRKQEELKAQYDKEQDLYNNRALLSTESKEKLQLNFMYEAPPGAKRERQKEDDEPEFKFEWQRKYNAPREDYAKGKEEIRDQPFGIAVRNVRCIKCHKWGHINTDKECPLYTHASSTSMPKSTMDPLELMQQMREDGFGLKKSALGHQIDPKRANEQFVETDDDSDPEMEFLKSLSSKQKRKLLKRLNKLSKKQKKRESQKAKEVEKKVKKKDKGKSKKKKSDSDSESEVEEKKSHKKTKIERNSSESSDSDAEEKPLKKEKKAKVQEVKEKPFSPPLSSSKNKQSSKNNRGVNLEENSNKTPIKIKTESPSKSPVKIRKNPLSDDKTEEPKNTKNEDKSKETDEDKSRTNESEQNKSFTRNEESKHSSQQYLKKGKSKVKSSSSNSSSNTESSDEEKCDEEEGKKRKSKDDKKRSSTPDKDDFVKPHKKLATSASIPREIDADPCSSSDIPDSHPDGFDPEFPQRRSFPLSRNQSIDSEQNNSLHERFRARHRHRRSPSVKQKYRND